MAASYISVPRDLTKVKSKVMFNLTKRQLIDYGFKRLTCAKLAKRKKRTC